MNAPYLPARPSVRLKGPVGRWGGEGGSRRQLVNSRRLSSIRETRDRREGGEGEGNDKIESWDLDDLPGIADAARRVGRIKRVNGAEGEGGREILAGSRRFTLSYTRRDYFPKISAHKRFRSPIQTLQKTIRDHPPSALLASFQNETQIVVELENIVRFRLLDGSPMGVQLSRNRYDVQNY